MSEYTMTVTEFCDAIRPDVEHSVDQWILGHEAADRAMLLRHREQIVQEAMTRTRVRNLEARLAECEAKLRPRLVPDC